jgi:hypothetical protein
MKSDKGYRQTRPPCLYWFILLTGIVPFVVIFVVFNDIFYLVTAFVVLLTGAEAADKTISGARHLPDQGAVASRKGWLAGQRSEGLGRDVWVVDIQGVQSHLSAEQAEPIEQVIGAPLRGGQSRPQDPEAGTILFLSFHKFFVLTCL